MQEVESKAFADYKKRKETIEAWEEKCTKTAAEINDQIVKDLSAAITDSMIELIRMCLEQRLRQILPLIKEGLTKGDGR